MSLFAAPLRRTTRTAQGLVLLALPHGGQQLARRNAWASMSADSARARARREASAAMDRASLGYQLAAASR